MSNPKDRVHEGATFLDVSVAGWYGKITQKTLAIEDDCKCVIGQIFGNFNDGCTKLGITKKRREFVIANGFYPAADKCSCKNNHGANLDKAGPGCEIVADVKVLTAEWKKMVQERRKLDKDEPCLPTSLIESGLNTVARANTGTSAEVGLE